MHSFDQQKRSLVVLSAFVLGFLGFFSSASALTVSPVRIELSGDPGQVVHGEFLLINEQGEQRTFYLSSENFEAQGEQGTPTFVEATEGLATWIETVPSVTIARGEKRKVPFSVRIPKTADPGGHFAAIFAGTNPSGSSKGGQVTVGAKIGVLILLRVNGEIVEGGGLLDFKGQSRVATSLPFSFSYRFQNTGGDRLKPVGDITITNSFGLTTAKVSANGSEGNVLPNSTRKFTAEWLSKDTDNEDRQILANRAEKSTGFWSSVASQWDNFAFGLYTARVDLAYGEGGSQHAVGSYRFFMLPWQFLLVALFGSFGAGWIIKTGIGRYNQWIIKKSRQHELR